MRLLVSGREKSAGRKYITDTANGKRKKAARFGAVESGLIFSSVYR
jgi:hypothetical protein